MTESENYLSLYNSIFKTNYTEEDIFWIREIINNPKLLRQIIEEERISIENNDWDFISACQKLSEDFIREFEDRIK